MVEVTVAIGIFAFVVVAILGLFPAALRLRTDSALETRAVMIANELFASVRASTNIGNVTLRAGPNFSDSSNIQAVSLAGSGSVVVGYPANTCVPFYMWYAGRGGDASDPTAAWERGEMSSGATANAIQTLAKLYATQVTNNLYQVTVEVRAPAVARLERTPPMVFTTLHYSP